MKFQTSCLVWVVQQLRQNEVWGMQVMI